MKATGMQALKSPARRGRSFWLLTWLLVVPLLASCGESPAIPSNINATASTQLSTPAGAPAANTQPDPAATSPANPTATGPATTQPANASPTNTPLSRTGGFPTDTASGGQTTPGQATLAIAPATITKSNGEKLNLTIELARTDKEQETGLMGRQSVPDDTGMLFIFKQPGRVAFWMKDTPLALSIAFIAQDGKIVDIQDMESFSLDTHAPNQDYIYALEVSKGYFARKGVKPGDTFNFKG